jgi:ElaB/YqjD/DUF883 family membrane-anchored ribosome-binding protein
VPEFDTYPASARIEPERELPAARDPRLERKAEKIGSTLGETVAKVQELPRRLQEMPERMSELGQQMKSRARELREDTRQAVQEMGGRLRRKMEDVRERASAMPEQAREYSRQNPFQVIAGVAIAAFCIGIGLRIWRSS